MGSATRSLILPAVALVLGLACGDSDDSGDDSGDTAATDGVCSVGEAVLIGTGQDEFVPLEGGEEVDIIYGPQGGWHIWESIETYNLGSLSTVHFTVTLAETGEVVSETVNRVGLLPDDEISCRSTFAGIFGYLEVSHIAHGVCNTPPELVADREVCLAVEVEDQNGATASNEVCVVAVQWEDDPTGIDMGCE